MVISADHQITTMGSPKCEEDPTNSVPNKH
ncbi:hypothetical protein EVAR_73212_1, partial [Eumeta japonica]